MNEWNRKLSELPYEYKSANIRTKAQFNEFAAKYDYKVNLKKTLNDMYLGLCAFIQAKAGVSK